MAGAGRQWLPDTTVPSARLSDSASRAGSGRCLGGTAWEALIIRWPDAVGAAGVNRRPPPLQPMGVKVFGWAAVGPDQAGQFQGHDVGGGLPQRPTDLFDCTAYLPRCLSTSWTGRASAEWFPMPDVVGCRGG